MITALPEWTSSAPLDRGNIYSWVVIGVVEDKGNCLCRRGCPALKFQALSAGDLQSLNELKATRSHLALSVFSAKVGLLSKVTGVSRNGPPQPPLQGS